MFDHLLESSRWDDSYKLSNIGFDEEIGIRWDYSYKLSNIGLGEEIGIIEMELRTISGALLICFCHYSQTLSLKTGFLWHLIFGWAWDIDLLLKSVISENQDFIAITGKQIREKETYTFKLYSE